MRQTNENWIYNHSQRTVYAVADKRDEDGELDYETVCELPDERTSDFNRTNATLIAAAPDLLAACKEIYKGLVDYDFEFLNDDEAEKLRAERDMLEHVIAKAKGWAV